MEPSERHSVLFARLVLMLHAAAMQHLGKVKNPLTDRVERDLPGAQGMIDTLAMIESKTKGNLSAEEGRMLTQILQELRLNYVDEAAKPDPVPAGDAGPGGAPPS
ncbi:MAG TPA: DUF1844 domain-containing protein [Bacteroidota bacterium]|nr:DUF1844 domain-containing protein [Bacteroidota bacterium]